MAVINSEQGGEGFENEPSSGSRVNGKEMLFTHRRRSVLFQTFTAP
jgi:hypothetical protein